MLSAELDMRNIADHALIFDCDGVLQRRIYSIKELFEQANFLHSQTLQSEFQQVEAAYLTKPDFDSAIRSWTGERRISEIQTSQLLAGYISVTIFSDILELIQDLGGDDTVIGIATDLTDFRAKERSQALHNRATGDEIRIVRTRLEEECVNHCANAARSSSGVPGTQPYHLGCHRPAETISQVWDVRRVSSPSTQAPPRRSIGPVIAGRQERIEGTRACTAQRLRQV